MERTFVRELSIVAPPHSAIRFNGDGFCLDRNNEISIISEPLFEEFIRG